MPSAKDKKKQHYSEMLEILQTTRFGGVSNTARLKAMSMTQRAPCLGSRNSRDGLGGGGFYLQHME